MVSQEMVHTLSLMMIFTSFAAVEARNLRYATLAYFAQALLLCGLLAAYSMQNSALIYWAATALVTKALLVPWFLWRSTEGAEDETRPMIGFAASAVLLFVVLYLAIRLVRPEQLVNPEVFDSVLVYISALQAPAAPFLPSTWAYDCIQAALRGSVPTSLFHLALAASFAAALACLLVLTADAFYFQGFSKTQTAAARVIRSRGVSERLFRFLPGPVRAFTVKEIKTFLRDQAQWTQLFLIAALLVIYIYNFDALPLEKSPIQTVYLQNLFSFLNMGLALFVLTAVTARQGPAGRQTRSNDASCAAEAGL